MLDFVYSFVSNQFDLDDNDLIKDMKLQYPRVILVIGCLCNILYAIKLRRVRNILPVTYFQNFFWLL